MARKSTNPATEAAVRSTSKRAAPETPSRQSKRAKSTTRKSYAEPESDDDIDKTTKPDSGSDAASDFEVEDEEEEIQSSEHDLEEASSEEETSKKTTARGRNAKASALPMHKKKSTNEELWKQGATLEPGTRVVIKKPKAREAGDTPYTDDTIHPNTMLFLRDLAANNDRQWLKAHDPDYRTSLQDFNSFLESLTEKVIEADETIPELPVKDIIFRIYRDIRFSKDPTPYKTHFSAAWSRTGRKGPYAAYYVQIQPKGGSFVGGGLWMPEAQALSKLRQDIDRKPHKIKRVLTDAGICESFFGGISNDEKKAIKAFTNQSSNKSNALKKHPKGYAADHQDIELLRLRNFTLGTKLRDEEVVGEQGLARIAGLIETMVPFITYLNGVVMPDEASSDEESEGDSDDDDNDEGGEGSEGRSGADVDEDGSGDA